LTASHLLSVSVGLSDLDISYQWNHTVYMAFCDWLLSLKIIFLRSICVMCQSFIFLCWIIIFSHYSVDIPYFIYSSVDGHLVSFQFLVIMNTSTMHIGLQVWYGHMFFYSIEHMPSSGIAESYSNLMTHTLRICQTVYQSGCTSLLHFIIILIIIITVVVKLCSFTSICISVVFS
jgi:hypothetical protein